MNVLLVSEGEHEASGALESLVQRLAPGIQCTWRKVSDVGLRTVHGKGQGFFKRAMGWVLEARRRGFDGLIMVIDEDERPERIAQMTEAQCDQRINFPRALGVAIHTFDAWMLADEQALSSVLSMMIQTQKDPESTHNAKGRCAELMVGSSCQISQRELYAQIAQTLRLERLEERCPKGFGTFANRVRALTPPN